MLNERTAAKSDQEWLNIGMVVTSAALVAAGVLKKKKEFFWAAGAIYAL